MICLAFFIGPIIRWLFADIGLHGTYVVIISIFISVIVGKYLKERSVSAKTSMENRNKESLENNEIMENRDNTKNESMENKEEDTRTESRRDIKHREREERRQHRRERRNRW